MARPKTIAAGEIHAAVERLAGDIAKRHAGGPGPVLLGIANGGVGLARRLARSISARQPERPVPAGVIDISFHRDDIGRQPIPKEFAPTLLPCDIDGAQVVLVDDVLYSGRTVKAALDELFDHGRPARVELAVLVDREGRRLPIAADYVGLALEATDGEKVEVSLDDAEPSRDAIALRPA